jgi:MFS family permease
MLSYDETERNLKNSVRDGVFASIFTGFTKSFIAPLAIAMKASNAMVAAFSSVPDLLASLFQLSAITAVNKAKSRRQLIVWCAALQALVWLPIILAPFFAHNILVILILVSITTVLSQFMQPIWNSLMGDIVPEDQRGRFFGSRNVIVGVFTFTATITAGFVLNHYAKMNPYVGFAIIFSIAVAARIISVYFKTRMSDIPLQARESEQFSLLEFVRNMSRTNYGMFVIYVSLLKFATYIAAPFFAIYMLKDLGFSYLQFTLITSASLIANFLFMAVWGNMIDKHGSKRVLYIAGMLVPFVPLVWFFAATEWHGTAIFIALFIVEAFSGAAWAGFDLGSASFIFDAVKPENRVRCIAYNNLFIGVAVFLGTSAGSLLVHYYDGLLSFSSILLALLISGILRLMISIIFLPKLREVRLIEVPLGHTFFHRILDIKPRGSFEVAIFDRGLKVHVEKPKPVVCKKTDHSACNHGKGTVDILKESVVSGTKTHFPKMESQAKVDKKAVENIVDEIKRGKFPKEFRQKR